MRSLVVRDDWSGLAYVKIPCGFCDAEHFARVLMDPGHEQLQQRLPGRVRRAPNADDDRTPWGYGITDEAEPETWECHKCHRPREVNPAEVIAAAITVFEMSNP